MGTGDAFALLVLIDLYRGDARVAQALAEYDAYIDLLEQAVSGLGEAALAARAALPSDEFNQFAGVAARIKSIGNFPDKLGPRVCKALGGTTPALGEAGDGLAITGFSILDAAGDAVRPLRERDVLDAGAPGMDDLSIRADVPADGVGSVRLELVAVDSGASTTQVSGAAPHTLRYGAAAAVDEYYVSATPYPAPGLGGTPGATLTVRFRVADFDAFAAGADRRALWSDGDTLWVVDGGGRLYAYDLTYASRDEDRDIQLDAANADPRGIWSDRELVWIADGDGLVYAYGLATAARDPTRDIVLDADNADPRGIWSDRDTLWVADTDGRLYAYSLDSGWRRPGRDIFLDPGNSDPGGIWSDGGILWVVDRSDGRLYAYDLETGGRSVDRDVSAVALGIDDPADLWSDGDTLWTLDGNGGLGAMSLPEAPLGWLSLTGVDTGRFDSAKLDYSGVAAYSNDRPTVVAEVAAHAAVRIEPADADPVADGHQVDLAVGDNTVTVTVTGTMTLTYTVRVRRQGIVKSISVIDVPTGDEIAKLKSGTVVNLGSFYGRTHGADEVDLRANLSSDVEVGSIGLDLTLREIVSALGHTRSNTRNKAPYSLYATGDQLVGAPLAAQDFEYQIVATPYPRANRGGVPGTPYTAVFAVRGDIDRPIAGFTLVDAAADEDLMALKEGAFVDLGVFTTDEFTIRADIARGVPLYPGPVNAVIYSVELWTWGRMAWRRTENYSPPFALFGDNGRGNYSGRALPAGNYHVYARACTYQNLAGKCSSSTGVGFRVGGSPGAGTDTISLDGFEVYHPGSGEIADIVPGGTLQLDPTAYYLIRANPSSDSGPIGSVRLELSGPGILNRGRTDNFEPFQLLSAEPLPAGDYEIRATPYTGSDRGGEAGATLEVSFAVTARAVVGHGRPTVSISAPGGHWSEGDALGFTLTRTEPATDALTVGVSVTETGNMLAAASPPISVTFPATATSVSLTLAADDDPVVEAASLVTVAVLAGAGYLVAESADSAAAWVADNDEAAFSLSVNTDTIEEGDYTNMAVAITNGVVFSTDQAIHFSYGGTASPGTDYVLPPASLVLPSYGSSRRSSLVTIDDDAAEDAETVVVTASHDGSPIGAFTLTIAASDAASDDATLSALSLTDIDVAFFPETTVYTADVDHEVASTTVTATPAYAGASVVIADADGSTDGGSRAVALAEGANTITVTVTAADGVTTRTYTVTVTRAAAVLAEVSVAATGGVTEGNAATFVVTRAGAATDALTVGVSRDGDRRPCWRPGLRLPRWRSGRGRAVRHADGGDG